MFIQKRAVTLTVRGFNIVCI